MYSLIQPYRGAPPERCTLSVTVVWKGSPFAITGIYERDRKKNDERDREEMLLHVKFMSFFLDDYSRIILPTVEGKEGSDYINGNYIKVYVILECFYADLHIVWHGFPSLNGLFWVGHVGSLSFLKVYSFYVTRVLQKKLCTLRHKDLYH